MALVICLWVVMFAVLTHLDVSPAFSTRVAAPDNCSGFNTEVGAAFMAETLIWLNHHRILTETGAELKAVICGLF